MHKVGIDPGADKRGEPEQQLRQHRKKRKVFLSTGGAQQRVDRNCNTAMPIPIEKSEISARRNTGASANSSDPAKAIANEAINRGFSPNLSSKNTGRNRHHSIRKEKRKGEKPASARLSLNPSMMSGTSGPSMFVNSEMTKKMKKHQTNHRHYSFPSFSPNR